MIVRSVRPEDFEMPLEGFDSWITPIEHFFVRSHMSKPTVDLAAWRLNVQGEVSSPLNLTMDELKKLPAVEVVSVLECAGNGRSFYQPTVTGMQWTRGGVGNGRWRGVRLADVLKKAGMKPSAKHVLFNGADTPPGTMPDFMRTVPLKKALDADMLLAFEMNGEALPVSHGFPLRLIVPGWYGMASVKWLDRIEVIDRPFDGYQQVGTYIYRERADEPGVPITTMRAKSLMVPPGIPDMYSRQRLVECGRVELFGRAWSGAGVPIAKVEVAVNGRWHEAVLDPEAGRYAWRGWRFEWQATPGEYELICRTTDRNGERQPLEPRFDRGGFGNNAAQRVQVTVR
jgi:DMSO/TMAO reductase YedYZ molybdopterin-dependent catalytic subunit